MGSIFQECFFKGDLMENLFRGTFFKDSPMGYVFQEYFFEGDLMGYIFCGVFFKDDLSGNPFLSDRIIAPITNNEN